MSKPFVPVKHQEGWVFASPRPSREELQAFYADLYYQSVQSATYQESYGELDLRHKALRCDVLLQALCERGLGAPAAFLDVGAGEGFLMDAADRAGFEVTGLDYSAFGVSKFFPRLETRLRAGDVIELLAELAEENQCFSVCSALNVLEHVLDPAELLAAMGTVLAPGGVLAITVPNDYSKLQALLRAEGLLDRDFWFSPPQHLSYFNAENLPGFCAALGFELVDAFSDFLVDLYLLHPGSNYIATPANGPDAHRAR